MAKWTDSALSIQYLGQFWGLRDKPSEKKLHPPLNEKKVNAYISCQHLK